MGTTNILDLNNRVSDLEKAVSGGDSAQANKKDIATEFSATTAYTAGCFVYYQGKLYQFNTDHAAGAWDSTDVVEANVTDQVTSNAAAIAGLTASDVAYDNTDSGLTATDVQGAVDELAESYPATQVMMSDGVTSVEEAIDDITPRTASGTTLAQLQSALDQLSLEQKVRAKIFHNGGYMLSFYYSYGNDYGFNYTQTESNGKIYEQRLLKQGSSFFFTGYEATGTSITSSSISFTSWTLYYQGTPIS